MSRYRGKTFAEILDANRGVGQGFDLLRLGLALLILVHHISSTTGHSGTTAHIFSAFLHHSAAVPAAPPLPRDPDMTQVGASGGAGSFWSHGVSMPFVRAFVPMFFALSGFLVTGSAMRTRTLVRFLGLRVLRILPALFVEVLLSAVILGAVFTELPLRRYFTDPGFFAYFFNIVGYVHFYLPGVFRHSVSQMVNGNLWTLPFELECYLLMSVLIVVGALHRRGLLTTLFLAATVGLIVASVFFGYEAYSVIFGGRVAVYFFAMGVMFYLWRDRIIFHELLFLAAGLISYGLLLLPKTAFICPLFLTYVTLFIGLMPFRQFSLLKSGDYSYGIYLYSYPLTQALVAVVSLETVGFLGMIALATTITCMFAFLSWHGVEKHFLKLKPLLSRRSSQITETLHPGVSESGPGTQPPAPAPA